MKSSEKTSLLGVMGAIFAGVLFGTYIIGGIFFATFLFQMRNEAMASQIGITLFEADMAIMFSFVFVISGGFLLAYTLAYVERKLKQKDVEAAIRRNKCKEFSIINK